MFSPGLTGLVASNFRGKTSVLELVTWCLRGAPRNLRTSVRDWLSTLDLDAEIAGQPLGFRLDIVAGEIVSAVVLAGPNVAALASTREADPAREISAVLRAQSTESFAEQIQAFMMDRLDLHPLVSTYKETGTQTHGWPAYFGALYLPAGGDKALLGDHAAAGLPGRLLQVFLDLPAAAALTRVKTALGVRVATRKTRLTAEASAAAQQKGKREELQQELDQAIAHLQTVAPVSPGGDESLADLASRAVNLAGLVADAQQECTDLLQRYRRARSERQRNERQLNDVTESATARLLFHGLDPKACPRCDQEIEEERRRGEREAHACAVCSRRVDGPDDAPEEVKAEAEARLEASTEAERLVRQELDRAEAERGRLIIELAAMEDRLRLARSAANLPEWVAAQERVLRLEGALSVYPELAPAKVDPVEETAIKVLKAADKILEEESKNAAAEVFVDLNKEIAELGRRFGMTSLERVEIDRAAHLKVTQDGGVTDGFGDQSAGARLRLRIAVAIALLRVGAAKKLSTHPGLLLIDSPKAEEVQDLDAHTLVRELSALAVAENLQILVTTADPDLFKDEKVKGSVLEATDGKPLW
ncbi:hypothetical protein OH807_30375 [Kitasatospora sp. NBC_01560]|uniref:hypothetical protein n=1 Tax=Kitasatospora sp. NBC_01560 TaxID=2975965 RepID=UPI0038666891